MYKKGDTMKIIKKILFTFLLINFSWLSAVWGKASLDPELSYSCIVTKSNNKNVPIGAVTVTPLSVQSLESSGSIHLKTKSMKSHIDFYGPLMSYDRYVDKSGFQAFAIPPTEPREIHGSITVEPATNDGLELSITLFHTTRAFDNEGSQVFIFTSAPDLYTMNCSVN